MARRSSLRTHLIRTGRKTFWFTGLHSSVALAGASTAVIVSSLNAAALALRPFTIVRTRGFVGLASDQVIATENQGATYGEIIVSDQALAIGVTAVPTPVTDSQSGWHVFEALADQFDFVSGVGARQVAMNLREIDSKAMRKVEEGQDLVTVLETAGYSSGIVAKIFSRVLIKLH